MVAHHFHGFSCDPSLPLPQANLLNPNAACTDTEWCLTPSTESWWERPQKSNWERAEESIFPTCHVMVSMVLTNQRRSSHGRKTSYGTERALDLSTARLGGPWTNPRPARKTSNGWCLKQWFSHLVGSTGRSEPFHGHVRSGTVPCPLFFFKRERWLVRFTISVSKP